jgi:hypothetical protein
MGKESQTVCFMRAQDLKSSTAQDSERKCRAISLSPKWKHPNKIPANKPS